MRGDPQKTNTILKFVVAGFAFQRGVPKLKPRDFQKAYGILNQTQLNIRAIDTGLNLVPAGL
jgi:hypothetical protein